MNDREREQRENMVMDHNELGPLALIVPWECRGDQTGGRYGSEQTPGIYLKSISTGRSPEVRPRTIGRLLAREEALEVAALLDRLGEVRQQHSMRRDEQDVLYPHTNVAFIELWYDILGRRLQRAIDAVDDRRGELREVRAALTGQVG